MTFQAVIFDFGGVLVRTLDQGGRWRWDERLGLPLGSVERTVFNSMLARQATTGAAPVSAIWEDVAQTLGLDADQLQQFRRDSVSYTHLRAHETVLDLVCRLLLEKKTEQHPLVHTTSTF